MEGTDLKTENLQRNLKYAGTGVVVVAASAAVAVVGASAAVAGVIAVVGLLMVNFVVPVSARAIAIYRQKTLTAIAETFSEETIRDDEEKEGERIRLLEQQYVTSRSEIEGAQDELKKQLKSATNEEKTVLTSQVTILQGVIDDAESVLKSRKVDFNELQRVNKLYIALYRSASAMQKAQGSNRNPEELQRIEIARNAIKTKMRSAMAGKTVEAMNLVSRPKNDISEVITIK
ncbi:hypothetical protein UFOVP53_109 [uncultured Caudovirales phage]|uniref:Uncharacterized protein n=1 Tax=uncultured Caudovirales phage TaxID=2100421 RepID=A0A6J5KVE8_9CAUD|nr:hypothetical protein UFOVP53_109 [uncultured Caudovirales phage]